jgi:hypothetical protein
MAKFTKKGIENTGNDKPVIYTLKKAGKPVYIDIAKRGRVQDRLNEHLNEISASEFFTRSYDSIAEAREAEERKIKREKPKFNEQHTG